MTKTTQRRLLLGVSGAAILGSVVVVVLLTVAHAQDPVAAGQVAPSSAEVTGAPSSTDAGAVTKAAAGTSPNVKIVFKVIPPNRATVTWGKKKLGMIKPKAPLIIQRPRDSGPLDVVVRAEGCLPIHSRAYTFTDTTLAVRVTPVEKKNTLYGYREDVPANADGGVQGSGSDGGSPPLPAGSP